MAAARLFSFSSIDKNLLHSASPAVAGNGGRNRGFFRPSSVICPGREPASQELSHDIDFQEGLSSVQALLRQHPKSSRGMMTTVDHLKRLCIDHYFQDEIDNVVDTCVNFIHSDDLLEATISTRLLREAGYCVSADEVLQKFVNGNGDFNLSHSKDIRGLLILQDMSHLNMGESLLYKAKDFSSKHLTFATKYMEPNLASYVTRSLDHPYHVSLMRYKARHHLTYLQSLPTRNIAMEKLALAEFHVNKVQHQREMQEVKRWWMSLGLAQEIPAARDQVLKWYMWPMTVLEGSSFSRYRIEITKIISLIYIVDDIFDLVATQEELSLFNEAIKSIFTRLLREAGYCVSADDVLQKFVNGNGDFNLSHRKDIRGLLSLQDMSHLNMGESLLYKAKDFSSKHLRFATKYMEPNLATYVTQSLDHPYHVSLMRYKARHHLTYLQSLPTRNIAMEKLALAEFHVNKVQHQREMQEVKRWWMSLGLAQEIPAARDQILKWYMWPMTILEGLSFSRYRIEITKIISLIYIVNDIFDIVATQEELSRFNEAINRWDLAAADSLPSYMTSCYKALYTITNDIADMARKEHGSNPIHHLKKSWAKLFNGFMIEGKWLSSNQVPTSEDYLRNGVVTSGAPLVFIHLFFMLGHDLNEAGNDHIPRVVSCPAKIMRLRDDMGSAKDEAQEGLDGSYKELYLRENPHGDVEEHMMQMIAGEWEELNRECFSRKKPSLSPSFIGTSLNFARMVGVMYGFNNDQRLPALEDYTRMLLL